LMSGVDAQDIITLNLTRAVQICTDIAVHALVRSDARSPTTMGASFTRLAAEGWITEELAGRLGTAVGFRNSAMHGYDDLDSATLHRLTTDGVQDLEAFATAIARRTW
jgi:uncharacterized protein YutE (UPF0331/DUF86 family)